MAANRVAFGEAVHLVFSTWDTLNLAVTNEWGGPDSVEKAEWFADVVVELFDTRRNVDQWQLEDVMDDILSNEFNTIAEDNSIQQISQIIMRLFTECSQGNLVGVNELRRHYPQMQLASRQSLSSSIRQPGGNDAEEDDDDVEGYANLADVTDNDVMTVVNQTQDNIAQIDEPPPPVAAVDPDGWQTVPTRTRRR